MCCFVLCISTSVFVPPDLLLFLVHLALSLEAEVDKLCPWSFFAFWVLVTPEPTVDTSRKQEGRRKEPQGVHCSRACGGRAGSGVAGSCMRPQQPSLQLQSPLGSRITSSPCVFKLTELMALQGWILEVPHHPLLLAFHRPHVFINCPFIIFFPVTDQSGKH